MNSNSGGIEERSGFTSVEAESSAPRRSAGEDRATEVGAFFPQFGALVTPPASPQDFGGNVNNLVDNFIGPILPNQQFASYGVVPPTVSLPIYGFTSVEAESSASRRSAEEGQAAGKSQATGEGALFSQFAATAVATPPSPPQDFAGQSSDSSFFNSPVTRNGNTESHGTSYGNVNSFADNLMDPILPYQQFASHRVVPPTIPPVAANVYGLQPSSAYETNSNIHQRLPHGLSSEHQTIKKDKRSRTSFSSSQVLSLEKAFQKNKYLSRFKKLKLAFDLNLMEKHVKVWFQNRRTKSKKEEQVANRQKSKNGEQHVNGKAKHSDSSESSRSTSTPPKLLRNRNLSQTSTSTSSTSHNQNLPCTITSGSFSSASLQLSGGSYSSASPQLFGGNYSSASPQLFGGGYSSASPQLLGSSYSSASPQLFGYDGSPISQYQPSPPYSTTVRTPLPPRLLRNRNLSQTSTSTSSTSHNQNLPCTITSGSYSSASPQLSGYDGPSTSQYQPPPPYRATEQALQYQYQPPPPYRATEQALQYQYHPPQHHSFAPYPYQTYDYQSNVANIPNTGIQFWTDTSGPGMATFFEDNSTPTVSEIIGPINGMSSASGIFSGMSSGISNGMSSGMSSGISGGMSSGMSSGMSNGMSSGMFNGMSSETQQIGMLSATSGVQHTDESGYQHPPQHHSFAPYPHQTYDYQSNVANIPNTGIQFWTDTSGPGMATFYEDNSTPTVSEIIGPIHGMSSASEIFSGMSSGISNGMSSGMSSGISGGMSSGMSSGMSNGMSSGMFNGMSSETQQIGMFSATSGVQHTDESGYQHTQKMLNK